MPSKYFNKLLCEDFFIFVNIYIYIYMLLQHTIYIYNKIDRKIIFSVGNPWVLNFSKHATPISVLIHNMIEYLFHKEYIIYVCSYGPYIYLFHICISTTFYIYQPRLWPFYSHFIYFILCEIFYVTVLMEFPTKKFYALSGLCLAAA